MDTKMRENEVRHNLDEQVVSTVLGKPVTRKELSDAFDRVADKKNWKNPIDVVIELPGGFEGDSEMELISQAVTFFAGCVPQFVLVGATVGNRKYRVRAAGYYAAVGA